MRCPICKREFDPVATTTKPFCCERCRTIDLGRWLNEGYGLPVVPDPEANEVPEPDAESNGNGPPPQAS
ncbi:MAG: DNA gyrase inhibitor YacG [Pirellulales bacterium]